MSIPRHAALDKSQAIIFFAVDGVRRLCYSCVPYMASLWTCSNKGGIGMDPFANGEETLDPQDWDAMRNLGHRMVDDMLT